MALSLVKPSDLLSGFELSHSHDHDLNGINYLTAVMEPQGMQQADRDDSWKRAWREYVYPFRKT